MKLGLRCLALSIALLVVGCSNGDYSPIKAAPDAGSVDATPVVSLVCAEDFCGTITDKKTGSTTDCGSCREGTQCGDNNISNVCGASCLPYTNSDVVKYGKYNTTSCDYYLGQYWGMGYGTEMQFPSSCNYMDTNNCLKINIPAKPNEDGCKICGEWWCCVSDPDAGVNPLLPGAVSNNDGGLP